MLLLRLLLLALVAACSVGTFADKEDFDKAKKQEMYNCFFAILCTARKAIEFRRIMLKAHPRLIRLGFQWLKQISNIDAKDTPEFWEKYPDMKCTKPEKLKQKWFLEWLHKLGEYWAEACANVKSEECVKMAAAEHEYNVVNAEYYANGVCVSNATELAQKKMEDGKEAAGKEMEKGKEAVGEGIGKGKEAVGKGIGDLSKKGGPWGK